MNNERERRHLLQGPEQQTRFNAHPIPHHVPFPLGERHTPQAAYGDTMHPKGDARNTLNKSNHIGGKQKSDTLTQFLLRWSAEIAAIVISVAFIAAVYVVLLMIHDTSLSKWAMPGGVQPTTVIAALITLSKLFLLAVVAEAVSQLKWTYFETRPHALHDIEHFDSASRGAFGATMFLFRIRWRAVAASIGAIVTILALAMEPFAQQSVSFYSKTLPTDKTFKSHASIPRSTDYDLNTVYTQSPYSGGTNTMERKFYAPMLGAMLEGLYNPNNTVNYGCGSTNCTWSPFDTLGICSHCKDVSSMLKSKCHYGNAIDGGGHCTYETPSGAQVKASCIQNYGGSISTLWNSTMVDVDLPAIIGVASIAFSADNIDSGCAFDPKFKMPNPTATECTFTWCTKTIHSNVTNGTLTEHTVSSEDLVFPIDKCNGTDGLFAPYNWSLFKQDSVEVLIYAAFKPGEVPNDMCSDWQSENVSPFWINYQDSNNIYNLLASLFTQSDDTGFGTAFGELFYSVNKADLSTDVPAIAKSMTDRIRQGPNTTSLDGTLWVTETYIRVNWLWLIFPAALVLLAIVFLAITVILSAQKSRVVWKSSSLALLFHGLTMQDESLYLRQTSDMKQAAQGMRVRLDDTGDGVLKLVGR